MVAVHCRTGRGRTAAMIALWLMREYRLTARDATVWLRLVRPGTPRPRGLVANMAPRSHAVPLALPRRLRAQQGAGRPPLRVRPGARGAGMGRGARSQRARLGRPVAGDAGPLRSPRTARWRRGRQSTRAKGARLDEVVDERKGLWTRAVRECVCGVLMAGTDGLTRRCACRTSCWRKAPVG